MKLFILALLILLIIVILEVTNFYKEGLESGKLDSYVSTTTNSISKSLKSNIDNDTSSLSSFNNDSNKSVSYSPKILGGSLLTVNEEISPYSYTEGQAIIDPNAADLEAARTENEGATETQQSLWYGTDATIKANFEQVSKDNPLSRVAVMATKDETNYDEMLKVCSDNSFKKGVNPTPGKNDYMYGWDNGYDPKFPCVGFYSHTGSRKMVEGNSVKKYSLLTSCKNEKCDELPGVTSKIGNTYFPKYPEAKIDEVYGQKATNEAGRSLNNFLQ